MTQLVETIGLYHDVILGWRPHRWLVNASGVIVDNHASKFPSLGSGTYEAFHGKPYGRCFKCGKRIAYHTQYCSTKCHLSVMEENYASETE